MNPSAKRPFSRDQRTTIVYGMLVFVLIVVVLQLWLLTATMNASLGGDDSVVTRASWDAPCRSMITPTRSLVCYPRPSRTYLRRPPRSGLRFNTMRHCHLTGGSGVIICGCWRG